MIIKAIQKAPKQLTLPLIEEAGKVVHVPRPVDEQVGKKKNPIRIIE